MEFPIKLVSSNKNGLVTASESTSLIDDFVESEPYCVIRYQVQFENGQIVLYKRLSSKEWFSMPVNKDLPESLINETMIAIDDFESAD